jgi:hypothetical protein
MAGTVVHSVLNNPSSKLLGAIFVTLLIILGAYQAKHTLSHEKVCTPHDGTAPVANDGHTDQTHEDELAVEAKPGDPG